MIVIPSLVEHSRMRPNRPEFEENYLVPNFNDDKVFWENIHKMLYSLCVYSPTGKDISESIDPHHGYFGNRVHPVTGEKKYYHLGVEIQTKPKQEIKPLLGGILEYSGFGTINGYYILLSHPEIVTDDGYVLHTMYCHLKKPLVKFSSYQKMLREISLGSYPFIEVSSDTVLGLSGGSGLTLKNSLNSYLQCDFRKFDEKPIVVDPMMFYQSKKLRNKSRDTLSIQK